MATIEDVKDALVKAAGEVKAAQIAGATFSPEHALDFIGAALEALHTIPDPADLAQLVAHHEDRRRGARVRAKLDAAHGIRSRIEAHAAAFPDQPTEWRDGYIRGLEEAHKHVQSLSDADVGGG